MLETSLSRVMATVRDPKEREEILTSLISGHAQSLFDQGAKPQRVHPTIEAEVKHLTLRLNIRKIISTAWAEWLQRNEPERFSEFDPQSHLNALISNIKSFDDSSIFDFAISQLDSVWGGLVPGEIGVLAGAPGSMKTSLAIRGMEAYLSRNAGKVLFFSLDMEPPVIVKRRIQSRLKCNDFTVDGLIRAGSDKIPNAVKSINDMDNGKFLLVGNDEKTHSFDDVVRKVEMTTPNLVIVDYLTLLREPRESDLECVNRVLPELKRLAQSSKITLFILSQMGRGSRTEQANGKIGGHSKGGGIVEEIVNAEIELLKDLPTSQGGQARIVASIGKTRRGENGRSFELGYHGPSMTFDGTATEVRVERKQKAVFTSDTSGPA